MTFSEISFLIHGHPNILGEHRNTFEFTCDKELTLNGDCIVGVNATFSKSLLEPVLKWKRMKIIISCEEISEEIFADVNNKFDHDHEIVIRLSEFPSKRTLGIRATKSSNDFNRELIAKLKNPQAFARVNLYEVK